VFGKIGELARAQCVQERNFMKAVELGLVALIWALGSFAAQAQVRCKMPNGVVIEQKLAQSCPAGASQLDANGTVIAPAARPPTASQRTPAQASTAQAPVAVQPSEPSAYEYAGLICKALEQSGATTCDVNSNLLSTSTIEATLPTTPSSASRTCNELAAIMRSKTKAFEAKEWKILIYSPFSGNRPIASCRL
jgi:hypothetical protein